jgi:hypothetical protein
MQSRVDPAREPVLRCVRGLEEKCSVVRAQLGLIPLSKSGNRPVPCQPTNPFDFAVIFQTDPHYRRLGGGGQFEQGGVSGWKMADSARIFCGMSRFEIKDRLKRVVESDREDVAEHPGDEEVRGNEVSSLSERLQRNLALIRAYETRDKELPPQAPQRP